MRNKLLLIALLWINSSIYAQTTLWHTTHIGRSSSHSNGNCKLVYDKIKVTIHPFFLEVEEEAEISAIGPVWSGDSLTLEIVGQFKLPDGSALKSMLLWNGNKLLKAKLRDRNAADSAYEEVVDRDKEVYILKDPALIEYMGNNQYRYKIYPVAINNSRKIRICYSIPLSSAGNFELLTAFTKSFAEFPKTIPIEFLKSQTAHERYLISYGKEVKPIHFESTYLLNYDNMPDPYLYSYDKILIIAENVKWNHEYVHKVDSGAASGFYTAIYSSFPDTLLQLTKEMALYQFTCEAGISVGKHNYISQLPTKNIFSIFIKSEELWNGVISWHIYDEDGKEIITYDQKFLPDTLDPDCAILPLLWGVKYSLTEKKDNLGAIFGFVDNRMSLLALESDSLSSSLAAQYSDSGIPPLLPHEIVVDPSKIPVSPKENIIIDYTNTKLKTAQLSELFVYLLARNMIVIESAKSLNLKIQLYDLNGRLVYSWKNVSLKGKIIKLKVPQNLRGAYILKLQSGSYNQQKKLILK